MKEKKIPMSRFIQSHIFFLTMYCIVKNSFTSITKRHLQRTLYTTLNGHTCFFQTLLALLHIIYLKIKYRIKKENIYIFADLLNTKQCCYFKKIFLENAKL